MSLYEVDDYKLDPPEMHRDYCNCDECHAFHRESDEGIQAYAGECDPCADELAYDLERGVRCVHGEYVPGLTVDGYITDVECSACQIDYGPAYEPEWLALLNRVAA